VAGASHIAVPGGFALERRALARSKDQWLSGHGILHRSVYPSSGGHFERPAHAFAAERAAPGKLLMQRKFRLFSNRYTCGCQKAVTGDFSVIETTPNLS